MKIGYQHLNFTSKNEEDSHFLTVLLVLCGSSKRLTRIC